MELDRVVTDDLNTGDVLIFDDVMHAADRSLRQYVAEGCEAHHRRGEVAAQG